MNGHYSPSSLETSRILIIGSTGFIGRFIAEASLKSGHRTYLLVRPGLSCPSKVSIVKSHQDKGAIVIYGSISDQIFMEKVLEDEKIDVVISAVGGGCIVDQIELIKAIIKNVGTVKRFLPSEFGHDIDRAEPVEPGLSLYKQKRKVRRFTEETGVPFTYVCCNSIAAWPYHDNTHPADVLPPLDRFHIYGDGSVKAYFVAGTDIGKFTIKLVDDPRTLNKTVHFRPHINFLNINELASLWEEKIGYNLPRVTVTEDDLLAAANDMIIPESIVAALTHDIFIKGCQITYSMDKETDVEVCSLYPDVSFKSVDRCFTDFITKLDIPTKAFDKSAANNNGIVLLNSNDGDLVIYGRNVS